jgi:hypothetical protein
MTTIEQEIKRLPHMFNEIGLYADTRVCRLIGFADSEVDYYYILMFPALLEDDPEHIVYSSMVGPWVSLKGHYRRYKQLDNQMTNVWNCPPQDKWRDEKINEYPYFPEKPEKK